MEYVPPARKMETMSDEAIVSIYFVPRRALWRFWIPFLLYI
jgi:hypothetical protein